MSVRACTCAVQVQDLRLEIRPFPHHSTQRQDAQAYANGYSETEKETAAADGYSSKCSWRGDPAMTALDSMPDSAKEALYAFREQQLVKKDGRSRGTTDTVGLQ